MTSTVVIARKFTSPKQMLSTIAFMAAVGLDFGPHGQSRYTTLGELRDYLGIGLQSPDTSDIIEPQPDHSERGDA